MATAMPTLDLREEQESFESEEITSWEDTAQGATRLLETQRKNIEAEIEYAKSILGQPEVDGEESFYSEETLDRAIAFLKTHIEWAWRAHGAKAPIPTIGPGPHRSVDLYWKQPSWKLLVNVPANKDLPATFYGDNYGRQKIKGSLDPTELSIPIIAWLMA
jgi:hypothetical protein